MKHRLFSAQKYPEQRFWAMFFICGLEYKMLNTRIELSEIKKYKPGSSIGGNFFCVRFFGLMVRGCGYCNLFGMDNHEN